MDSKQDRRDYGPILGKINDHLSKIDTTLAAQHENLKDHIRRTELLEEQIKPVNEHIHELKGVIKFFKFIGIMAAIAEAARIVFAK